jgi:hypothetical protein
MRCETAVVFDKKAIAITGFDIFDIEKLIFE